MGQNWGNNRRVLLYEKVCDRRQRHRRRRRHLNQRFFDLCALSESLIFAEFKIEWQILQDVRACEMADARADLAGL